MGFDITPTEKHAVVLNKAEEELPSESEITKAGENKATPAKANDIELQEIGKSMEDLITQFEGQETLPMQELLGLDKQLRSIRGTLKVEVAKKVQLEENIKKEHSKIKEFRDYPGVYDDAMREDITKQIAKLNDELKVRHESIDPLKGRLKNQITSFKEMIAKVLDKDTSLAEKI